MSAGAPQPSPSRATADEPSLTIDLIGNGGGSANFPIAQVDCPTIVHPPKCSPSTARLRPTRRRRSHCRWSLVDAPSGFENDLFDPEGGEDTPPASDAASLLVDLAGDYEVQFRCRTKTSPSAPSVCRFAAVPENAIHVELFWDEVAADLDLHFAQEGYELFQSPGDVNWCNPSEWEARPRPSSVPQARRRRRSGARKHLPAEPS